jgi:hypothetical protein
MGGWSCEQCGRNVTSNPLLCDLCGSGAPGADPAKVALAGQRDLHMEAHLRGLSIFYRGAAVLVLLLFVIILAGIGSMGLLGGGGGLGGLGGVMAAGMGVVTGIALVVCTGWFVLNHFVARFSNAARIVTGVFVALSLALQTISVVMVLFAPRPEFPSYYGYERSYYHYDSGPSVGWALIKFILFVAWTTGVLWVLFSRRTAKMCTEQYRDMVAKTPEVQAPWYKSPFFVVPTGLITMAFILFAFMLIRVRAASF